MAQVDNETHFQLISTEIERHLEDAEISKLAHYNAAGRLDKVHRYYLGLPVTVAALLLSCLVTLKEVSPEYATPVYVLKLILGVVVTVSTGVGTFLSFNEIASKHRLAAHRYQSVYRRCKNWLTDFPDERDIAKAQKTARIYREELTEINKESPQIPKWAYNKVDDQQRSGLTSYFTDKNSKK